ncbi:hypothetical protein Apa02nite_067520 [Actinoplanes palleronii]|uniref:DUF1579 domain-containing protein n=2 Tax=Actinoplanes palleronii TaxID=113570 RepID=A0ABQ4BIZ2_9ACTN|nr:hypothetical protein Apa02nite_067520 [Actinoplanes palleronii]
MIRKNVKLMMTAVAVLAVTMPAAAHADTPAETAAVKPAPVTPTAPLQPLNVFAGSWKCTGSSVGGDGSPIVFKTAVGVEFIYDGHFMRWSETTSINGAVVATAEYTWGWQASDNSYDVNAIGSLGQRAHLTTPGWAGDSMTLQGTTTQVDGAAIPSRLTLTTTGAKTFTVAVAIEAAGQWIVASQSACTQRGSS